MNDGLFARTINTLRKYQPYVLSTFLYLGSSLVSAAIGIITNPLMAKNLSPEDYAIIGYFGSYSLIAMQLLNFSLISYYLRNYYILPEEKRQKVTDTILIALVVYGFVALIAWCIGFYFFCKYSRVSFPYYPYAILTFAPIYMSNISTLFYVRCRLNREAGRYSLVTIVSAVLSTFMAIMLVVVYKNGAVGRLWAALLGSFITAVYCFSRLFEKMEFDFNVIKDALRFGWPLSVSGMLWYFISGVDRAMVEKLNDSYTFGFYNVGIQIAGYFSIFYMAISQTFDPNIYKAIAENNKKRLAKIIGLILALNAIPNIAFIVFAPLIISILTANRYIEASGFAQILALKNITISFYYTVITVIVGYGFTKSELLIRVTGAVLCVLMYKGLIGHFGFYGAAWGQVLAFIIMAFLGSAFLCQKMWNRPGPLAQAQRK